MQLPTKIGPLTLMRQLKEDGLTEDYAGILDEPAGQQVYVRRLAPGIARDGMMADIVRKRVADLTGIEHPALCHVRELVSHEGDLLFVEDWVDAVPLGHIIQGLNAKGERLPAEVLLHLAVKACNALEALHGRPGRMSGTASVLHMALSPDAFLLKPDGEVMLGAYGVLRSPLSAPPGMTGSVMAPLNYLAPEQTRPDGGLSTASDIFGLGSVLYEAATGQSMFRGASQMAVVSEIRKADITAQLIEARNVIPGFDRVLQRCFAGDPRHRFQRAFVLREDLRALMANYSFGDIEASTATVLAPFFSADTSGSSLPPPSTPDDTGGILLSALGAANTIDLPPKNSATSTLVPADELQDSIDEAFGRPSTDEVPTTIPSRFSKDFSEVPTDIPQQPARPTLSPPDDDDDVTPSPQSLGDETSWVQSTPPNVPADTTGWIQNPRASSQPVVHDEGTDSVVIPDSEDTGSVVIPEDTGPVPPPAAPAPPPPAASFDDDDEDDDAGGGSSMMLIAGVAAIAVLVLGFVLVGGGGLAAAGLMLGGGSSSTDTTPTPAPPTEIPSVADATPPATNGGSAAEAASTESTESGKAATSAGGSSSSTARSGTTSRSATPTTRESSASPSRSGTSSSSSTSRSSGSTSRGSYTPPSTTTERTAAVQDLAPPPPEGTGDDELQFEVEGDLSVLSTRARAGELTDAERQKLESSGTSDPDYTRANVILYQDAKSRGDLSARAQYLDQLMKLPENTYNPQFLVEQAELDLRSKKWDAAIEHASTAERYWARLPSDLIFSRKAMIYEAQAGGWQGKFYASGGEDAEALRHAIRSWEKYENHVGTKNRADLALRANDQLTKLREMQRRLEY